MTASKSTDTTQSQVVDLHKFQHMALASQKRIIAMIAGLQSGKTTAGALWMRKQISMFTDPSDTFIVAVPSYSILISSTFPAFMRYNSQLGHYHKTERVFYLHHGPQIFFRSMDNPYSCEGITNCRGIWLDEGGLCSTHAWINLMGRAAPKQCPIFISTTPYNLYSFLYLDIYEPWRKGARDDVACFQFPSIANPYFPIDEYERQKTLLDPRMFAMRFEGRFERMAGLVYQDLDEQNMIDPFHVEKRFYHIYGGIDWGYSNAFAIVIRAISRDGKHDYQIGEYYRAGHTPDEQVGIIQQFHKQFMVDMWIADSEDPGMIQLVSKRTIPIRAVDKLHNSLQYGIAMHQAIIRTKTHQIFRGKCENTMREYESYVYPDARDEKNQSNKPLDYMNHAMSATRYITMMTQHLRDKADKSTFIPAKTHLQRLLSGEFRVQNTYDEW